MSKTKPQDARSYWSYLNTPKASGYNSHILLGILEFDNFLKVFGVNQNQMEKKNVELQVKIKTAEMYTSYLSISRLSNS